ncbi:MAG: HNH endonuclease [Deltaproteobacteria bacterium]|nr:HNH endonuclease [Deltaproteobacteria bacterium]
MKTALGRSRRADAEVIRFLAEVDERKLYREQACSSMFGYCVERLGMSEGGAYQRIRVARLSRELPVVLEHLAAGRVHLAGLNLLAGHLNGDNVEELMGRAAGKSKRAIEELVRELAPLPDVKASVRKVRAPKLSARSANAPANSSEQLFPGRVQPAKPAKVQPLAPARFHVQFTASQALKNNLERAQELAGHKPGRVANPRSRYIARAIKREVFERDQGQCTFVDDKGRRCSERKGLHFDHVVPHARGGASTADNLRLRCGPHNQLAAEQAFGPLFMQSRAGRRKLPGEGPALSG